MYILYINKHIYIYVCVCMCVCYSEDIQCAFEFLLVFFYCKIFEFEYFLGGFYIQIVLNLLKYNPFFSY